eukprot:gnl/TRDRNA2_/TRDRNA2_163901_c0_seq12.p1 gnl/TRDRNA2_/TRDRNA2_163901_c0~~gnl/TRDRNA2_/TRDRNA2_163901_c0_seq12.p1  ORF type:complete len:535 (+),score=175.52 gnl/TRDRNA2_/TRDRNA2_163901_c0_seq12:101-1705(+)
MRAAAVLLVVSLALHAEASFLRQHRRAQSIHHYHSVGAELEHLAQEEAQERNEMRQSKHAAQSSSLPPALNYIATAKERLATAVQDENTTEQVPPFMPAEPEAQKQNATESQNSTASASMDQSVEESGEQESREPGTWNGDTWDPEKRKRLPKMNAINVFRAQMCMNRADILAHKKCMKFLKDKCKTQTTGHGYCKQWAEKVVNGCKGGNEDACEMAKDIDLEKEAGITTTTTVKPEEGAKKVGDMDNDGDVDKKDQEMAGDTDGNKHVDSQDETIPADTNGDGDVDGGDIVRRGDADNDGDVDHEDSKKTDHVGPDGKAGTEDDVGADGKAGTEDDVGPDGVQGTADDLGAVGEDGKAGTSDDGGVTPPSTTPEPLPPPLPAPAPSAPEPAPAPVPMLDMSEERPLPKQGFDEFDEGKLVNHDDKKTMIGDWGTEWPEYDETEGQTEERICRDNPNLYWCRLMLKNREENLKSAGRDEEAKVVHDKLAEDYDPDDHLGEDPDGDGSTDDENWYKDSEQDDDGNGDDDSWDDHE